MENMSNAGFCQGATNLGFIVKGAVTNPPVLNGWSGVALW